MSFLYMYLKKVIVNIPNIRKSCKKEITFMKSYFSFVNYFYDFIRSFNNLLDN